MSENVQNNRQNHKIYHGSNEKLKDGINSERKNFSSDKNPERHLPRRCAVVLDNETPTIY